MSFDGKVCLITGGGQGLGRAVGEQFMREGAAIGVLDINATLEDKVTKGFDAIGGRFHFEVCDVADQDSAERAVAATAKALGGVDYLINCAARHLTFYSKPPTQLPRDHWRMMLEVNVIGIVNVSAACRPFMAQRGGGVILNFASNAGFHLRGAYGISKLAVRGLTNALAAEFSGDSIRVCGIAPGFVSSPAAVEDVSKEIIDWLLSEQVVKRLGQMEDVVNACRFLCSDQASFISGETLLVSGGFPLRP